MPTPSTLAAFAVAALLLIALPGPNLMYLLARTISEGRRAGVLSALGIETGTLVHITAAAVGLSALLASSAQAFAVVRYAGAAYLLYLGVRTLLGRGHGDDQDASRPGGGAHVYRQAVLVQVLNPKVALFFLAFLPQFVDPDRPAATQILVLGAILAGLGLMVGVSAALTASALARRLRRRGNGATAWGRWASGCVYLVLGAFAALSPAHRPAR